MAFSWGLAPLSYDLIINRSGKLQTVYGVEEVRQRIIVTLNHFWAEYFLAVDHGLPWYEIMLGARDFSMVEMLIRRAVLDVPGVISLVAINTDKPSWANQRKLSISMKVEVEGQIAPAMIDIEFSLVNLTQLSTSTASAGPSVLTETGDFIFDELGARILEG
jgi:hypothetical protein